MAAIHVNLTAVPPSHSAPRLLLELGAFLKTLSHGALGWFDGVTAEPIPREWSEAHADRLTRHGFAFLQLPDGSLLALLDRVAGMPVILLGSEGELEVVGTTLGDFLRRWSVADTGVADLDDEDAYARLDLRTWLDARGVPPSSKAAGFDVRAWLAAD